MLYFYFGTNRKKIHAELAKALSGVAKKSTRVIRLSDVSAPADVFAALLGGGMFAESRVVVFDSILQNDDMREAIVRALPSLASATDIYFIVEEKPDADTRKRIEKQAARFERFDAPGKGRDGSIFELAYALRKGEKRRMWLGLQREYAKGSAPEAVHGTLFWGAKDMFLKASSPAEKARARGLVAHLAELPHEARRRGEDLEYALERFVLSGA